LKALLLLLATAGCTTYYDPCFGPKSQVSDLRVLAVNAEPPEVLYDPVTFAAPPVRVRALVVEPGSPDDFHQIAIRACVPAADGRCPAGQAWDGRAAGSESKPPDLVLQISPERIQAALAADPLAGYGGVRVQIELRASSANATATASKLLIFNPAKPGYVPNHGLYVTGFAVSPAESQTEPGSVEVPVGQSIGLRPLLAPGPGAIEAAETYQVTDLAGRTVQLRERISYSFFTLAHAQFGPLGLPVPGSDVADEPAPGDPQPQGGLVTFTSLSAGIGRIWVVARDGRGAEAWASLTVLMPDRRGCTTGARCPVLDFGCL
jgi:hypothetical protein